MKAISSAFETMRGSPNSGRGGSSGWTHIRTPASSAVGITSRRKRAKFSRRALLGHAVIALEHLAQARHVVAVEGARQPGHDVGQKRRVVSLDAVEPVLAPRASAGV